MARVDESNEAILYRALNASVIPVWLAMILFPRARLTERIVGWSDAWLVGLSAAYVAQLGMAIADDPEPPDFSDAAAVRAALSRPGGFLTGWTHFLAFDLFVGRWIWRTATDAGRTARLATFLTLMAGPAGFGVFAVQRRSWN